MYGSTTENGTGIHMHTNTDAHTRLAHNARLQSAVPVGAKAPRTHFTRGVQSRRQHAVGRGRWKPRRACVLADVGWRRRTRLLELTTRASGL